MERRIGIIGAIAIAWASFGAAWYIYHRIRSEWGLSPDVAWWIALAVFIAVTIYFSWRFDKE